MQREIEAILPAVGTPVVHRAADLRYLGQIHTVTVAVSSLAAWSDLRREFDAAHERAYGYSGADVEVELINLRLTVVFPLDRPRLPSIDAGGGAAPFETRKIYSTLAQAMQDYRVYQRDGLRAGQRIEGPAAIEEAGTTTVIEPGDVLTVEPHGCLVIDVTKGVTA
jgi:N-methylhydantoinase A